MSELRTCQKCGNAAMSLTRKTIRRTGTKLTYTCSACQHVEQVGSWGSVALLVVIMLGVPSAFWFVRGIAPWELPSGAFVGLAVLAAFAGYDGFRIVRFNRANPPMDGAR